MDFVSCLLSGPRGIIIACNAIDGLAAGLFNKQYIRYVLDTWRDAHEKRIHTAGLSARKWNLDELLVSIDEYHRSVRYPSWWTLLIASVGSIDCHTAYTPVRGEAYAASRPTQEVWRALSPESARKLRATLLFNFSESDFVNSDIIRDAIRTLPEAKRRFLLDPLASIPQRSNLLWFTRQTPIRQLAAGINSANAIRDVLGLVHYPNGMNVAAVFFRIGAFLPRDSVRPTFAEANTNRRFMAVARSKPNHRTPSWGRTVDLRKLRPRARNFDGLVERLAAPIRGASSGMIEFVFMPLGKTFGERGASSQDSDDVFARFLLRGRTLSQLRAKFKNCAVR